MLRLTETPGATLSTSLFRGCRTEPDIAPRRESSRELSCPAVHRAVQSTSLCLTRRQLRREQDLVDGAATSVRPHAPWELHLLKKPHSQHVQSSHKGHASYESQGTQETLKLQLPHHVLIVYSFS